MGPDRAPSPPTRGSRRPCVFRALGSGEDLRANAELLEELGQRGLHVPRVGPVLEDAAEGLDPEALTRLVTEPGRKLRSYTPV